VRDFRRFFLAAIVSNSGTWLQTLALPYVIFEMTDSASWLGFAAFAQMIPMALMGPFAGSLADRMPRRRILLFSQSGVGLIAIIYMVLWSSGVRVPAIYVAVSVVGGLIGGFGMPAWQAFVSDLVPRELLMNAITLNSTQFNAARLFGPAIGGVVLARLGPSWSFGLNAASYLVVIGTLLTLPDAEIAAKASADDGSALTRFRQAATYVRSRPGLQTPLFVAFSLAIFAGSLTTVHALLFAEQVFNVDGTLFGLMVACFGVGAVLASPFVAAIGPTLRRSTLLLVGLGSYGLAELLLTATTIYVVGAMAFFLAGMAHLTTATASNSTLQLLVEEEYRGRVMAIYLMTLTMGIPVGALVQGTLADVFGPRPVVAGMAIGMLGSVAWLALSGRVFHADRTEDGPALQLVGERSRR